MKLRAGQLELDSGLGQLASLTEVDVDQVGVGGAKTFFEAKVQFVLILKNKFVHKTGPESEKESDRRTMQMQKQSHMLIARNLTM